MVIEVSPVFAKAQSPMLVTLLGIVSEVREEQPQKALCIHGTTISRKIQIV